MRRSFLALSLSLIAVLGLNAQVKVDLEDLRALRGNCDSLSCPEEFALNYRLLAENLEFPYDDRVRYLEIAEQISRELADYHDILAIYARKGRMAREKGDLFGSLKAFGEGMEYIGRKNSKQWLEQEAWFLTGYGILLYQAGLYQEALSIFKDCAETMHRREDQYGEAVAWNNVGLSYRAQNQLDSAEYFFQKAFEIRKGLGSNFLLGHSLIYLARVKISKGLLRQADSLLQVAQDYADQEDPLPIQGEIYLEWAEISFQTGDIAAMKSYLKKAEIIDEHEKNERWLDLKIKAYKASGNIDSAIIILNQALLFAQDVKNRDYQFRYLLEKGELLKAIGRTEESNQIFANSSILAREILEEKTELQGKTIQVQSDFNNNRQRIKLLEEANNSQQEIIHSQNITIIVVTVASLILLVGFIIFYRLNANLRRAGHLITLLSKRTISAANAVNNAVFAIDELGDLAFVNHAAERYFRRFHNFEAKRNRNFISQFQNPERARNWETWISQAQTLKNLQKMGHNEVEDEDFYHVISIAKIEIENSDAGYVVVITDISDSQKQSQELSKKSKALEQANEAKEKMLSLLAHDLKEGVIGSLELAKLSLNDDLDAATTKQHLQMISDSLSKTKTLLMKTLDWVKEQSKGMKLHRNSFYLDRLLKDVLHELQDRALQKEIDLINDLDKDLQVKADPNAMRVVLRNLLSNGIKYVKPKSGRIEVLSEILDQVRVKVTVKDNGIGMSAAQVNQILLSTNRQSKEGTQGEQGTAIGLPLCQELLLEMGSSLQIDSALDQGSEFYFILQLDS